MSIQAHCNGNYAKRDLIALEFEPMTFQLMPSCLSNAFPSGIFISAQLVASILGDFRAGTKTTKVAFGNYPQLVRPIE